ncbi:hypothetical protein GRI42_05315 [Erythrobacter gaetbuli]|uniref:Cell wall polymerase n=1 Tax=Qipengyuania gaetbuli TaxID=266952 RepID=A0A844Y052_9SPHN|nr:hypothetical protein [Qipengyuania gaetbuli]MXO50723.1 hypothetical protein [Qipengyuania gaetbuli]
MNDRYRLMLSLAVPAVAGLAYLAASGAPAHYLAINGGGLLLALGWIAFGRVPDSEIAKHVLQAVLLALFALPLFTGPDIEGVRRWLPLGPMSLHAGMLLIPLLVCLCVRDLRYGPWVLGAGLGIALLQPDAASATALALVAAALSWMHRKPLFAAIAALGLAACIIAFGAGDLPPEPLVEHVFADAWAVQPLIALALAAAVFTALVLLLTARTVPHEERVAMAAAMIGFTAMSLIGNYPTPILGYGAAPILGFGLALGAVPRDYRHSTED